MTITIIVGDTRERLREMPSESVNCIVTSPPYFGLRSYLPDGHPDKGKEIGLEQTPEAYVAELVAVFRECRRVLRKDGVAWLNLGDSYNADGRKGRAHMGVGKNVGYSAWVNKVSADTKPKDLLGIPWMVAFALRADGWYLRSDIIFSKPNPMPESVRDRPTKAHEYVFLLTKSERYWYDANAIAEEVAPSSVSRLQQDVAAQAGSARANGGAKTNGPMRAVGTLERRNARSVWTIATQPFTGSHFATMPPQLAERCIKAGCPAGGVVLDPFGGAGTTALVADRLGRHATIIELNPEYADMARERVRGDSPLLVEISAA